MILTGRGVGADEALEMGLANRLVPSGSALDASVSLADEIAAHPQTCLRNDRTSALTQWGFDETSAMRRELELGFATIGSGETATGAAAFSEGAGRHGRSV
jgi:enoyl-CoA hydratase